MRAMPWPKKAQASVTCDTQEVSHKPHLEQCSLAGNRSGQPDGSMGVAAGESFSGIARWNLLLREGGGGDDVRVVGRKDSDGDASDHSKTPQSNGGLLCHMIVRLSYLLACVGRVDSAVLLPRAVIPKKMNANGATVCLDRYHHPRCR